MVNPTYPTTTGRVAHLRPNWWVYLLNGILTLLFGIVAFIWPTRTLVVLEQFFGAFALISGIFTIAGAFRARNTIPQSWWMLLLVGLVSIIVGLLALAFPITTLLTFAYVLAAWAIISGILEIVSFFSMRNHAGQWWLILSGVASIIFGLAAIFLTGLTLDTLIIFVAVYAIFAGVMRIIFAFQVRSAA